MRSRTSSDIVGRCRRCLLRTADCFCANLPTFKTDVSLLLVRQAKEELKSTNSGRWASLVLPEMEVYRYGCKENMLPISVRPGAWLLFPDAAPRPSGHPTQLVILDATWAQARRIYQRTPALQTVPRFSLAAVPSGSIPALRQRPSE